MRLCGVSWGASSRTLIERSCIFYFTHFTKGLRNFFFSLLRMTKCNLRTVVLTVTLLSQHFDKLYVCIYSRDEILFYFLYIFFFQIIDCNALSSDIGQVFVK